MQGASGYLWVQHVCWLAQRSPCHIKYADGLVRLSKSPSKGAFLFLCRQTVKMIHFARRRMLKKTTQRPGRQLSCKSLAVTGWESALMIFFLCPQRASPCFVKTLTQLPLPLSEEGTETELSSIHSACKMICTVCVKEGFI